MRQSQLFARSERTAPRDEVSRNAELLIRGGFIRKISAGVYAFLPLGWRVIEKISRIVREEMNATGAQEMFMPALVEKKYLDATGRWDVGIGFEVRGKKDKESALSLGWTHEEVITAIAAKLIHSYKDMPLAVYQIQTKFRNEPRPQGGLLRTREFLMKDLYSFHASEEDFKRYYEQIAERYLAVFKRAGLEALYTVAPGGDFTKTNTHEFQVVADVGEDTIFVCGTCHYAENKEITKLKDGGACPKCHGAVAEKKSIEVGNIFPLGTKYSEALGLEFVGENGKSAPVTMGSYGIGIGRLMATVVEIHNDKHGIRWPDSVAPFAAHLLELPGGSGAKAYNDLQKAGVEVLYDERNSSAGEKFADADLLGIPWRLVVSSKTKDKVEVKRRGGADAELKSVAAFIKTLRT